MAKEDQAGYRRSLSVDIDKPTDKAADFCEDFPSPPPLYTPTTQELEDTLDKEMADNESKKPALAKQLSLSIDKPTYKATEEEEPPAADVLPTPSAKEVENALEADMKGWKDPPKEDEDSSETAGMSKAQKKKAKKKKAKQGGETKSEPTPAEGAGKEEDKEEQPQAYVPGAQWEPEEDDDEDDLLAGVKPIGIAAPPVKKPSPDASPARRAPPPPVPAKPASPAKPAPVPEAPKEPANPPPAKAQDKPEAPDAKADEAVDKPTPSKLNDSKFTVFKEESSMPAPSLARTTSDNGTAKKWAEVQAPVVLRSGRAGPVLVMGEGSAPAPDSPATETAPKEEEVPEPEGPFPLEELRAGNSENWPKGIKPNEREKYLSTEVFQEIFKMDKAAFAKLRAWKKNDLKKAVKLF